MHFFDLHYAVFLKDLPDRFWILDIGQRALSVLVILLQHSDKVCIQDSPSIFLTTDVSPLFPDRISSIFHWGPDTRFRTKPLPKNIAKESIFHDFFDRPPLPIKSTPDGVRHWAKHIKSLIQISKILYLSPTEIPFTLSQSDETQSPPLSAPTLLPGPRFFCQLFLVTNFPIGRGCT